MQAVAQKRVARELTAVMKAPIEGITVHPAETLDKITAEIVGPEDTPFAGGRFEIKLVFGEGYPDAPPAGFFTTKIFHPNVSDRGEICVNTLKRDWSADLGLRHVLMVIRCLLIEPNPESALNEEAGRLLLEDYQEYCSRARIFTSVHATPASAAGPRPLSVSTGNRQNAPAGTAPAEGKKTKKAIKRL